jgi:dihydropteroate synthase
MSLKHGKHVFDDDATLMMAIVSRTPASCCDKGATWVEGKAFDRVAQVVGEGAEIVDIGGIEAAPGADMDTAEERRRVVKFVARVRSAYPDRVISVDTWRAEIGRAVCQEGADLLNDAWGGFDPDHRRSRPRTTPRSCARIQVGHPAHTTPPGGVSPAVDWLSGPHGVPHWRAL